MKKIISVVLALVMVLALGVSAFAEDEPVRPPQMPRLTIAIPIDKTVDFIGDSAPKETTFRFEAFGDVFDPANYENYDEKILGSTIEVVSDTITANVGSDNHGYLIITIPLLLVNDVLSKGFFIREVEGSDNDWTYSDTVYYVQVAPMAPGGSELVKADLTVLFAAEATWTNTGFIPGPETAEAISFTNTYFGSPELNIEQHDPIVVGGTTEAEQKPEENPNTGAAVTVAPVAAIIAGACVLAIGKKRK